MSKSTATRRLAHGTARLPQQALHLVDLENVAGGSAATAPEVDAAIAAYRAAVPVADTDHVVVATGPTLAPTAAFAWPQARLVIGHGLDGADRALLDWVRDLDRVAHRYLRIYLVSGDGIFSGLASALVARGVPTTAVARAGSMSWALRRSGFRAVLLDADLPDAGVMAAAA